MRALLMLGECGPGRAPQLLLPWRCGSWCPPAAAGLRAQRGRARGRRRGEGGGASRLPPSAACGGCLGGLLGRAPGVPGSREPGGGGSRRPGTGPCGCGAEQGLRGAASLRPRRAAAPPPPAPGSPAPAAGAAGAPCPALLSRRAPARPARQPVRGSVALK